MAETGAGERLKVFISYSRRDAAEFADELVGVLELAGFAPFLDRQDIAAGEDWEARLTGLIAESDTVVFVVSPEAIKSTRCIWEVDRTLALPKRLLPVVYKTVPKADIPENLRRLQFIHFDKAPGVARPLAELAEALRQDLGWIREHTRLGELAARWQGRGRPESLLLRGDELDTVKAWIARRNPTAPEITEAQRALIAASEEAESARLGKERAQLDEMARAQAATALHQKRAARLLWIVAVLVLALLGYVTWQSYDVARREMLVYTGLAANALKDAQVDRAMRYALQAYPARGSLPWLTPFSSELEGKLAGAAQAMQLHRLLGGHSASVVSAAFSPDGKRVVSASDDNTARIWDAASGEMIAVLKGHTDAVRSAAFSPDGKRVVSASDDNTARIWDAESGKPIAVLKGHTGGVLSAAFDPAGQRVVTASTDHTARIWEPESGSAIAVLNGHTQWVWSAAFDPDGKRVVTASLDNTARIWEPGSPSGPGSGSGPGVESGKQIAVLTGHTGGVLGATFDRAGKRVLTASLDGTARIWDAGSGTELAVLTGHADAVWSAAFDRAGKWVVTASNDTTARVWEAESGKEVVVLRGHTDAVRRAVFDADGTRVVTASDDATARIWDAGSGTVAVDNAAGNWDAESSKEIAVLKGHTGRVSSAAFDRDGKRIVTASSDHTARIWVTESSTEIAILKGHTDGVTSAAFDRAGKRIVTGSNDRTARIWEPGSPSGPGPGSPSGPGVASGKQIAVLKGHAGAVLSAAFDPDGKRIVTASDDKTARIWEPGSGSGPGPGSPSGPGAGSGNEIAVLRGHTGAVLSAAFDRDGKRVVTASDDATARIWQPGSGPGPGAGGGKEIAVLKGHTGAVQSAAFDPAGKRIVTASDDATARIWDAQSGNEIAVLKGHTGGVQSAAFDADGKRVVTASLDKTVRIWDAGSGKEIAVLKGHAGGVRDASFDRDGRRVVSASYDDTARIWDAQGGQVITVLKDRLPAISSAQLSPDGKQLVTGSFDQTARIWDVTWATVVRDETLRERVCAEKLIGAAQEFNAAELDNPILRGIDKEDALARNPCLRRGPLSLDYWTRLPGELWRSVRRLAGGTD